MNKAVFLDRDGVINKDLSYVYKKEDLFLLDKVVQGLKKLKALGYKLIVISNQSGVARGFFKEEDVINFHSEINRLLSKESISIDAFYYCPHYLKGSVPEYSIDCDCRKPKLGMIYKARDDFDLDLSKSIVIGDKISDMELASNLNVEGIQIRGNYPVSNDVVVCDNLEQVADYIEKKYR